VEAKNSVEDLIEACRAIARKLSLKGYRTTVIDRMTKLMLLVPEIMEDWQESSARGAAATVLAMCKAHFPAMDFAMIARGVPKGTNVKKALAETEGFAMLFAERVDHEAWYEKHDVPLSSPSKKMMRWKAPGLAHINRIPARAMLPTKTNLTKLLRTTRNLLSDSCETMECIILAPLWVCNIT
jgi:hypothetical protein